MQTGRIYQKGPSWFLRYREPVLKNGKKAWKDVVVRLVPRDNHFKNERAVEYLANPTMPKSIVRRRSGRTQRRQ